MIDRSTRRQRQPTNMGDIARQTIERIELDLVIVLAAVKAVEVGATVDAEQHLLASTTKDVFRF